MEITLGKALKLKNKLVGDIRKIRANITKYNSIDKGQVIDININNLYSTQIGMVNQLVKLKTAITLANEPIQKIIYSIAEHKGELVFLSEISIDEGIISKHGWGESNTSEKTVTLTFAMVEENKKIIEAMIETEQEQLDVFNYATKITVDEI